MDPSQHLSDISASMLTSVEAAALFDVTNDYVTQLCRKGKIAGTMVGRSWMVSEVSLRECLAETNRRRQSLNENLSKQMRTEAPLVAATQSVPAAPTVRGNSRLWRASLGVVGAAALAVAVVLAAPVLPHQDELASSVSAWSQFFSTIGHFFPSGKASTSVSAVVPPSQAVLVTPQAVTNTNVYNTYTNNNTYNTYNNGGISEGEVDSKLQILNNSLRSQISQASSGGGGVAAASPFSIAQRIDQLQNVTLTNATVKGLSGLQASEIPTLGYLALSGGTLSGAVENTSVATSTFAGGLDLTGGCFSINGSCISTGGGGGAATAGLDTQVQFNDAGSLGADASFTFDKSLGELSATSGVFSNSTSTHATTTTFFADGATTTSLFATTASSSNLFATAAQVGSLTISGLSGILKATAGAISTAFVDLTTDVTGVLPVANGGTNAASFAVTGNGVYYDGTRLVTAGNSSVTTPYASSTALTATSLFATNAQISGSAALGTLAVQGTGTSTFAGDISISGSIVPTADLTYSLGSATKQWKDLFVGPGSIYVNGQEVLHTDPSHNVVVGADVNQSLVLQTSGSGDLELNPTGTGTVYLKGNVLVTGGKTFNTSDNSALTFTDGIVGGNVQVSGNTIAAANTNGSVEIDSTGLGAVYVAHGNFGIGNTSPSQKLNVQGEAAAQYFTATSTLTASIFPYASTTALSATALCLSSDCRTVWPTGSAFPFTSTSLGNSTSTLLQLLAGVIASASTTIGNGTQAGGLTISGGATTTGALIVQGVGTSTFAGGLSALVLNVSGSASSTFANGINLTTGCFAINGTCLSTGGGSSQWTTSGSNIYYNSGNVGVGTTNPGARLDVSSATGGASSGIRLIQATESGTAATSYVPIDFTVPTSGLIGQFLATANNYSNAGVNLPANSLTLFAEAAAGTLTLGAGGASGDVRINTGGYALANERLRITSAGLVGIGTTSPYAKLSVAGQTVADYFTATSSTASRFVGGLLSVASTTIGNGTQAGGLTVSGGATTTGALIVQGVGTSTFAGAVGIGTSTPDAALALYGSSGNASVGPGLLQLTLSNNTSYVWGSTILAPNLTTGNILLTTLTGVSKSMNNSGYMGFKQSASGSAANALTWGFYSNDQLLTLLASGNVGIGTTSPYAKLSVAGQTVADYFTATSSTASRFVGGLLSLASTTIGNGTQAGGLTVSGGATTTGSAYFAGNVGIGTASPGAQFTVAASTAQIRLVSTADSNYARLTRTDTSGLTAFYNYVAKPATIQYSLTFASASSRYVAVTNNAASLDITGALTLVAWIKGTDATQYNHIISRVGSVNTAQRWGLLTEQSTGKAAIEVYKSNVSNLTVGTTNVLDGNWHLIVGVNDGTNLKIYVDGSLQTTEAKGGTTDSDTVPVVIGARATSPVSQYFNGKLDDVRVYSRALSPSDITTLYAGGNPSTLNLVGRWQFDEGSGTTATDASGNGNTGTLTNGPAYTTDIPTPLSGSTGGDVEATVFSSQDGADANEEGIQTFGWQAGRTNLDWGTSLRFLAGPSNTEVGRWDSSGNLSIGTSTAYSKLTVWGADAASSTLAFNVVNSASTTVFAVFNGGNAQLSGTLTQSSDQRLKTNVQSLDASSTLALIEQLNPVNFTWIDPNQGSTLQMGFIAQQVQKIFPTLVSTTSPTALTPDGTLGVNYIGLIAPIVESLKELLATVRGFAEKFTTHELCVDDVCVTRDQFLKMVEAAGAQAVAPAASDPAPSAPPADTGSDASSTPQESVSTEVPDTAATTTPEEVPASTEDAPATDASSTPQQ